MALLKPILQFVPEDKSKQLFQYIIRYATEFSSESRIQKFWQSSGFTLSDLLKSDLVDSSFSNEYDWLLDTPESEPLTPQSKENNSPRADPQLVRLFKSVNDQGTTVTDPEIITYIREVWKLNLLNFSNLIFISISIWIQQKNFIYEILSYPIWKHV
jgi:hypothetical protein